MNSLSSLPGLGPKTIEKLEKLGITTSKDLLYHFPSRYLDFSKVVPIRQARANETITISGQITNFKNVFTRSHKNLQIITVADTTGTITLIWFNQPYLSHTFKVGLTFSFAGTVTFYQNKLAIFAPEYGQFSTGKLVAVYPETAGLSSKWFRKFIQTHLDNLLDNTRDPLPPDLLDHFKLLDLKSALTNLHNPDKPSSAETAQARLALDEILSLQIHSHLSRQHWQNLKPKFVIRNFKLKIRNFIASLPFTLTPSQLKVWSEILSDLTSENHVTNRLLVGDVGSGKTIIAALSCYLAHLNHHLSALVAPTTILAHQHYQTFKNLFTNVPIYLLTAKHPLDLAKIPKNSIIISTHSLLNHRLTRLALIVFDEQHKFGVKQRNFLSSLSHPPHCLTMSATPIPRSISLTLLGNLDLSIIDTLPQNRLPIKTFLVPTPKQDSCFHWLIDQIKNTNCQAFIVCPFIEESETLQSIKAATTEFDRLAKNIFPNLKLALIHGKTKSEVRQKTIHDFQNNQINILVTTPIIEVGVDIPNASVMIILSADRFGLAQLHQLRGRVGRGSQQSFCYLFTESDQDKAINRLHFLETHSQGQDIAQFDLETRGPGEIFSTLQHGFPALKLANLSDPQLISHSRQVLDYLLHTYPNFDLTQLTSILPHRAITN